MNFKVNSKDVLDMEDTKQFLSDCNKKIQDQGRIVARMSGTEPLLRVMIECSEQSKLNELSDNINTQGAFVYDGISGATPTGAPPIPGENEVDTTEITDVRRAGFINLEYSYGSYLLTPQIAYSKESDYESVGLSLKTSSYFNDKNTTLTVGFGHDIDKIIPNFGMLINSKKQKYNSQLLFGLNQNINTKTILS